MLPHFQRSSQLSGKYSVVSKPTASMAGRTPPVVPAGSECHRPRTPEDRSSTCWEAGLLTPGSSAYRRLPTRGTFPLRFSEQWPCRFRSGYSGGGRAGLTPASLAFQQTLRTFSEAELTVKTAASVEGKVKMIDASLRNAGFAASRHIPKSPSIRSVA